MIKVAKYRKNRLLLLLLIIFELLSVSNDSEVSKSTISCQISVAMFLLI